MPNSQQTRTLTDEELVRLDECRQDIIDRALEISDILEVTRSGWQYIKVTTEPILAIMEPADGAMRKLLDELRVGNQAPESAANANANADDAILLRPSSDLRS